MAGRLVVGSVARVWEGSGSEVYGRARGKLRAARGTVVLGYRYMLWWWQGSGGRPLAVTWPRQVARGPWGAAGQPSEVAGAAVVAAHHSNHVVTEHCVAVMKLPLAGRTVASLQEAVAQRTFQWILLSPHALCTVKHRERGGC